MSFCPKCGSKKDSSNKCPKCDTQKSFYSNHNVPKSFCSKCGNPSENCTCNLTNLANLSLKKKRNLHDDKDSLLNNTLNNYTDDQNTINDNISLENNYSEKNTENVTRKKRKVKCF